MQFERLSIARFWLSTIVASTIAVREGTQASQEQQTLSFRLSGNYAGNILLTVEFMKDGEAGDTIVSKLESVEVGIDEDGEPISSCVVVEAEATEETRTTKLTKNQQTYLSILKAHEPIQIEPLNDSLRDAGIGVKRKADLVASGSHYSPRG